MAVLDDIMDGKGLKQITFNCFTCQNDNCIASGSKTETYQCPGYKHKKTNADRIRSMTNEELAVLLSNTEANFPPNYPNGISVKLCETSWLDWLKQEAKDDNT